MVLSMTSIKVASATITAISHWLAPVPPVAAGERDPLCQSACRSFSWPRPYCQPIRNGDLLINDLEIPHATG
jgi:hypothetical protein